MSARQRSPTSDLCRRLGEPTPSDADPTAGENAGSKLAKAQELGVPVLDEEGFRRLLAGEEL